MSDQGKANYEAYRDFTHGKSLVSGAVLPPWDSLPHQMQAAWNAGADAVEQWLADAPADEDAPGNEPAKVIIVERDGHPARLFAASGWEVLTVGTEAGDLVVAVDGDEWVAQIGARMWDSVCVAEAILPVELYARHAKKLAIAMDALTAIADGDENADRAAETALASIADVDL